MKTNFIKVAFSMLILAIAVIVGCKKNDTALPAGSTQSTNTDNYSSMADFFAKNGVATQTYIITGSAGGSFTTPQGSVISIPANSFYNQNFQLVQGPVTITFKDIYKKSDMLLSNMPTNMANGPALKSGGEFFIKATSGSSGLYLGNRISVTQPLGSFAADVNMQPFFKPFTANIFDTLPAGWQKGNDSLTNVTVHVDSNSALSNYVFSLYQFNSPVDSGTWCNSDNSSYFSAYPQTVLTIQQSDDPNTYDTFVFLVFKNINAMVHVYNGGGYTFPYNYAPIGLPCTVVAVGVKGGKVYSSFTPITITSNQTVNFSMTETTTAAFKSQLAALN